MKKTMALILVVLLVAVSFSGCNEKKTLKISYPEFVTLFQQKCHQFWDNGIIYDFSYTQNNGQNAYIAWLTNDINVQVICGIPGSDLITEIEVTLEEPYTGINAVNYKFVLEQIYSICNPHNSVTQINHFLDAMEDLIRGKNHGNGVLNEEDYIYCLISNSSMIHFSVSANNKQSK